MIHTAEQIIESIRTLPPDERERFNKLMKAEQANGNNGDVREYPAERFKKEQKWIHEHKDEYDGQFVLLEGDELLGHGSDPKELYEKARNLGIKAPFVKRMKAKEEPFFGGW